MSNLCPELDEDWERVHREYESNAYERRMREIENESENGADNERMRREYESNAYERRMREIENESENGADIRRVAENSYENWKKRKGIY